MNLEILADIASEMIEGVTNKKSAETLLRKVKKQVVKPQVEQEVKQGVESTVEPMVNTTTSSCTSETEAASSNQIKPVTFELNNSNIIQAVIYSELLTEPVCKKRRRWRNWS